MLIYRLIFPLCFETMKTEKYAHAPTKFEGLMLCRTSERVSFFNEILYFIQHFLCASSPWDQTDLSKVANLNIHNFCYN